VKKKKKPILVRAPESDDDHIFGVLESKISTVGRKEKSSIKVTHTNRQSPNSMGPDDACKGKKAQCANFNTGIIQRTAEGRKRKVSQWGRSGDFGKNMTGPRPREDSRSGENEHKR
jgi:hypothetical protein